jgi:ribosomal protein S27E
MSSAQERVKVLALEIKKAMLEAKAARARARYLGEELRSALIEAKAQAEAARTIVEYPVGRYECKGCRQSMIFSESYRELPACDNCGRREYLGAEPRITRIPPPAPKRYPAGIYRCKDCAGDVVVVEDADTLSSCDLCGSGTLVPP